MSESSVHCLGLCGNPRKEDLQPALELILGICDELGVAYCFQAKLAAQVNRAELACGDDELVASSDLIVALGGDGTMLRAARLIGDSGTPLLGINLGSLGYLTDIPVSGLEAALRRTLVGDYLLVGRSRVQCTVWRDGAVFGETAGLNDVVVNMGPLPRTLDLELRLGGTSLGRFLGDGVIFATAT